MEESLEFLPERKPGSVLFQDPRVGSEEASGRQCGLMVREQRGREGEAEKVQIQAAPLTSFDGHHFTFP